MRRGTWILALSGIVAVNSGFSYSAEPSSVKTIRASGGTTTQPSSTGVPNRYTRRSEKPAEADTKNYYDDLFADQKAPPATSLNSGDDWDWGEVSSKSSADKTASSKGTASKSTSSTTTTSKSTPSSGTTRSTVSKSGQVIPESAPNARKTSGTGVSQATYGKSSGTSEKKLIQQVRAEAAKSAKDAEDPLEESEAIKPGAKAGAKAPAPATGPVTPQVTIEWSKKGDINVGQECQMELLVKNSGSVPATNVEVDGLFPGSVRVKSAEPKPTAGSDRLTWNFDNIAPGAEHKISVKLIPSRRGDLGISAHVRLTGTTNASFRVEEPELKVALKGPNEVMLGDPAAQLINVSNPGTGTAHDVKVEAVLSEGLESGTRSERLIMEVGSIGPGETRTVRLPLSAIKGGQQTVEVVATSSADITASASAKMSVIAPSLRIAVDGPGLRYKGRNAKYSLTVSNDGSVPNNNIRVSQTISDGFKFVSADRNGKFDPSSKSIQWFVGRLEPGQSTQVSCELNAVALGDFAHTVAVSSDAGVRAETKIETKVDGIDSLTMELVDLDDPVETGAETAYEIRVRNQGSKAASGVLISCELPTGMELKTVKAPVDAVVEGRQIHFKPVDQIAPGAIVTYKVLVKGVQEGAHRMRVRMTGGGLSDAVVREESTNVYSDAN